MTKGRQRLQVRLGRCQKLLIFYFYRAFSQGTRVGARFPHIFFPKGKSSHQCLEAAGVQRSTTVWQKPAHHSNLIAKGDGAIQEPAPAQEEAMRHIHPMAVEVNHFSLP